MKQNQNILVVIEPNQMRQPALDRALALYNYSKSHKTTDATLRPPIVNIHAVMPINEGSWNITSFLAVEEDQIKSNMLEKYKKWLDAYLRIHAMGVTITQEVIYSKSVGKDLTRIAKEHASDLLIKTADVHGLFDSVFFTPLDWQMLRHSPIPVLIAKDHMWDPSGIIAVAIDVGDPNDHKRRLTNVRLLREAQLLSKFTGCKIYLINAIAPVIPQVAMNYPGYTPGIMNEHLIKEACKAVFNFAARHKIPAENCKICEGHPDEVIPALCAQLKPTALFIGTSARTGIASAFEGNICERVVDEIACDIAVVTPKTVISRIPSAGPTGIKS